MKVRLITPFVFTALVAGCQTVPNQYADQFSREGKPQAYIDGHGDGCRSGYNAAGNPYFKATKDPQRFQDDPMYAQGWTDGFNTCKARYQSSSY
ncbi:hypothetical protein QFZ99_006069 [Paraburkholderia atlantica]|uniref:hypothetical protein n=1 Tax=Paraburkholderia atlantica TaxID=2654982 RepID=UPI003D1B143D